jgi:putative phosphoribosyl transferase
MRSRYDNRRDAGQVLAMELAALTGDTAVLVIALPRGGVPVAYEVALALAAPLDVLAVHKLGAPANPEYAIGAVAQDGTAVIDEQNASATGLSGDQISERIDAEIAALSQRATRFRGGAAALSVSGRTIVLVDDGLATGMTNFAAIRSLQRQNPAKIILAAPVAAAQALSIVTSQCDQVVCPLVPEEFVSVGSWYRDFSQVSDDEVIELLERARARIRT